MVLKYLKKTLVLASLVNQFIINFFKISLRYIFNKFFYIRNGIEKDRIRRKGGGRKTSLESISTLLYKNDEFI